MARIIRPDSPARARTSIVAAAREALAGLDAPSPPTDLRDRLAYTVLALRELERSTERTAEAWERRGYWVKVDQFRREWTWAGRGASAILEPLLHDDLESALAAARAVAGRLPAPPASTSSARASEARWSGAFARLTGDACEGNRN